MSLDISDTIKSNSDRLNADDLIGGPITVQLERVTRIKGDQPVSIRITGGHMPFIPCLSMRRVLVAAWGSDASQWHGRWVTLYRDAAVKWGGVEVGGIRIQAMSDIPRDMTLSLTVTRGKKKPYRVTVLRNPTQQGAPTADLVALLDEAELTFDNVDAWRVEEGKPTLDSLTDDQQAIFGGWLAANPEKLEEIRKLSFVWSAQPDPAPESLPPHKPASEPAPEPEPKPAAKKKPAPKPKPAAKKTTTGIPG